MPSKEVKKYQKGGGNLPTSTLPTVGVTGSIPRWLKYSREYQKNNPFDLQEYVNKRFNSPIGRDKIKKN